MNHQQVYNSLISKRLKSPATGYTERHHILPRSLGGSDDATNLVVLTGREHWVAHLLLYKINPCKENLFGCHMMANCTSSNQDRHKVKNSRIYQTLRELHAIEMSKLGKQRVGKKNGSFGTRWICNLDLEENKKIKKEEVIPEGWIAGRNVWNRNSHLVSLTEQRNKRRIARETERKYINKLYLDYIKSRSTLQKFSIESDYEYSYVSLHKAFKKYVEEYSKKDFRLGLKH